VLNENEQQLFKPYNNVLSELCKTHDGIILRGTKLVIPESLRATVLKIAHEGHLGTSKTKRLVRDKAWFPGMDTAIEELANKCTPCVLNSTRRERPPLQPTLMPSEPWDQLAMDFFGPLPNKNELMVVIDEMSRFPVVEEVKTTAAEHVCPALERIFGLLGTPSSIKSDNGPPFNGQKFSNFCLHHNIRHRKITPEHPQANGCAERFMASVARAIRIAAEEKRDWRVALNDLLRAYRAAPHSTTGVAPNLLMFGRNRTSRLPSLGTEKPNKESLAKQAAIRDENCKQAAKSYTDGRRRATAQALQTGDRFFARRKRGSKFQSSYSNEEELVVTETRGTMVIVEGRDGRRFARKGIAPSSSK
jgi:transposase InsO family protein